MNIRNLSASMMPCFSGFQRMPSPSLFVPWSLICKLHDEQGDLLILPNLHPSMCLPMQISCLSEWSGYEQTSKVLSDNSL